MNTMNETKKPWIICYEFRRGDISESKATWVYGTKEDILNEFDVFNDTCMIIKYIVEPTKWIECGMSLDESDKKEKKKFSPCLCWGWFDYFGQTFS